MMPQIFKRQLAALRYWLSPGPGQASSRLQRFVSRNAQVIPLVARWEVVNRLQLHAQALTYDTLLAFVPLLAVVFAIVRGFGLLDNIGERLQAMIVENLAGSPELQAAVSEHIFTFVKNIQTGSMSAISILILIFSVLSLLGHIEFALNTIFGSPTTRPWVQRLLTYWAGLTLGPLLLVASIGLTAAFQTSKVGSMLEQLGVLSLLVHLLPLVVTWVAFFGTYMVVPTVRVRLSAALPAAIIAGSLWSLAKSLYAIYAKHAFTATNIYGSLAAVPLFILWIYLSWLLVLLGAQLAFAFQNASTYHKEEQGEHASQAYKERTAARVMLEVARHFMSGKPPTDPEKLAENLGLPRRLLQRLVAELKAADFVREVDNGGLVPSHDLERLTVADVLRHFRSGVGETPPLAEEHSKSELDPIFIELEQHRENAAQVTYRELAERSLETQFPTPETARQTGVH